MKTKPFIKFNSISEKVNLLIFTRPEAFTLLALIAKRAKRYDDPVSGLQKGEAIISDFRVYKSTAQSHRTNISTLKINGEITTRLMRVVTTQVLVAKLISKDIFDINVEVDNISFNKPTNNEVTSQPQKSTEDQQLNQQQTKNNKNKEKELKNNTHEKFSTLKSLTDDIVKLVADEYSVDFNYAKSKIIDIDLFCKRNGKHYKDYRAVLQTWIRGDISKGVARKRAKVVEIPVITTQQTPEERERGRVMLEKIRSQTLFLSNSKSINNLPKICPKQNK